MEQSDYLYHYTTVDAFISIIEKQELWASNIFYLNDTVEFHLAITLARELLQGDIDAETDTAERRRLEEVRRLLEDVKPGMTTKPFCFACSFSADDDDLSQWRAYCSGGGVAIGFHRNDLIYLTQKQGEGYAPMLVQCIYDEQKQREEIRSCISTITGPLRNVTSIPPEQENEYRAKLLQYFLVEKPIKHANFSKENEWRLTSLDSGMTRDERLGFRNRNGLITPYWKIDLNPDKDNRIWKNVRVTVGPCPHPHELRASIEGMLRRYCTRPADPDPPSDQVKDSKVTYCYW